MLTGVTVDRCGGAGDRSASVTALRLGDGGVAAIASGCDRAVAAWGLLPGVSESAVVDHPPQLAQGAGPGGSEAADRDAGVAGDLGVPAGVLVEHGVYEGAPPCG